MRFLSFCVVFFLSITHPSVLAETSPTSDEVDAHAILGSALEAAEDTASQRWAFSMRFTENDEKDGQRTYFLSFDPRRLEGERWEAISPTLDEMTKEEKKEFKEFSKDDNADERLVYDGLKKFAKDAQIISDDGAVIQYRGALTDDDMPEKIRKALRMDIFLDRASGVITDVIVEAVKPFKPVAVAKVKEMKQAQSYAPVGPNDEVLLVRAVSKAKGKAMLVSFSSETIVEYSGFEAVDAPAFPEEDEDTD